MVFPVFLVHSGHDFVDIFGHGWVIAIGQHLKKFAMGALGVELGGAAVEKDASEIA
jgi:azurin